MFTNKMAKYMLEHSLKNFNNLFQQYSSLEIGGDLYLISSSLESIVKNNFQVEGFKENLKIILNTLIDSLWANCKINLEAHPLSPSPIRNTYSPIQSNIESDSEKILKNKSFNSTKAFFNPESLNSFKINKISNSVKNEDLHLISEFSYIKGPTFNKQKRILGENKEKMPGPSDYHKNEDMRLSSSPKITIPKSQRKIEFTNSKTPAPGHYNPIKYFSSR